MVYDASMLKMLKYKLQTSPNMNKFNLMMGITINTRRYFIYNKANNMNSL